MATAPSATAGGSATTGVLAPVDAQRAIALLEDSLEKLAFLGSLTPDIMAHRDELAAAVGDEISAMIEQQHELEVQYEALIRERAAAEVSAGFLFLDLKVYTYVDGWATTVRIKKKKLFLSLRLIWLCFDAMVSAIVKHPILGCCGRGGASVPVLAKQHDVKMSTCPKRFHLPPQETSETPPTDSSAQHLE